MNKMNIIYSGDKLPSSLTKSIFLAGPSLRPGQEDEICWRKLALTILDNMGYTGTVMLPINKDNIFNDNHDTPDGYAKQIEWEEECLNAADKILFWVPRVMDGMPGVTTAEEYGEWKHSNKCVFGAPKEAEKVRYSQYYAKKLGIPMYNNLYLALARVVTDLGFGAERLNDDAKVPLNIWKHPAFKNWYNSLTKNNNKMTNPKVLWSFAPGGNMFAFILKADIWIEDEQRYKTNEFFFGRPDISSCVIYCKNDNNILNTDVVIVSEYRVPVRNSESMVYELPGGSSKVGEDPLQTVSDEIYEETGLIIDKERLTSFGFRQLQATTLSHGCNLYAAEIDSYEMELIKSKKNQMFGNAEDTEQTYLKVMTVSDILNSDLLDYSNIGMIMEVLLKNN